MAQKVHVGLINLSSSYCWKECVLRFVIQNSEIKKCVKVENSKGSNMDTIR